MGCVYLPQFGSIERQSRNGDSRSWRELKNLDWNRKFITRDFQAGILLMDGVLKKAGMVQGNPRQLERTNP